jgi:hypothetical protein
VRPQQQSGRLLRQGSKSFCDISGVYEQKYPKGIQLL